MSVYQSGVAPQYLEIVKNLMVQFQDHIFLDDIGGALNVLRYMLSIHFPEYRGQLTREYAETMDRLNTIAQVCKEKEGSNNQNSKDQLSLSKEEVFKLFTSFIDAYHTKDTFILKVQQFGGLGHE